MSAPQTREEFTGNSRFRRAALDEHGASRGFGSPVELPRTSRVLAGAAAAMRSGSDSSLRAWRRQPIPVRLQAEMSDCGPACLSMVLRFHGIDVGIRQLREDTNAGRDGVSARTLLETARRYGLHGRGVRVSLGGLRELRRGSILFWAFKHFVILDRMDGDHIYVIDPASGRRKLPVETVERMFTGVALEFETPATDVNRPIAETCTVRDPNPWLQLKRFVSFDRTWISLFASSVLILVFTFIAPLGTAYFVDTLSRSSAPLDGWATVAAILGLGALYFFLQLTRGLAVLRLQTLADRTVTLGALRHLLSLPLPFFTRRTAGDLALRVRTSTVVRQVLTTSVFTALFDGILLLTYLALLLLADLQIAALVLVLAAIQVGLLVKAWRRQTYLTADALESQAQADSELHEILEGVATVKSNGLEGHAGESWSNTLAEEINARTRSRSHLAVFSAASSSVQLSAPLLVLCLAASRVTDGALSIGSAVGYVALSIGVFAPLANLVQSGLQVAGLRASLSRLSDIFDTEPESRGADVTKTKVPSGVIELKDVHFSYPGGPEVLKSISLSIPEGSFCAIVGKSGCGKSTLAALLAGLLHPTVGDVSASSAVVRADGSVSLREFASFFNQDVRLSAGSIRDNISMGLPIADEGRIIAAAKSAHVHDEIMNLPMKYETLIGSGGAGLSGGQRQRVALARVLAAGPSLLILDEATSALDRVTEAAVLASIRGRGGTVVVITHRLSVARDADQVIHIDQGIVVGSGRHSELIASSRLYRELSGEAVNF